MSWQPAHETHAIERVTATFVFAEMISSKPWQALLGLASDRLLSLGFQAAPDVLPLQNEAGPRPPMAQFVISIGGQQLLPGQLAGGVPQSRSFHLIEAGEIRDQVSISRNVFTFTTINYQRWSEFRTRTSKALDDVMSGALETVDLSLIKLEYWDRFISDEPISKINYASLLNASSAYLPKFGFADDNLWHSHIGFFADPGSSARRLVNLNIDAVDVSDAPGPETPPGALTQRRSVGIYSMAQDNLRPEASPGNSEAAHSTLDEMHTILKALLASVITDAAAARISLNS